MLEAAAPKRVSKAARSRMMASLEEASGKRVFHLTTKGLGAMTKALTGSRQDGSRQTASRPRTERK